MKIRNYVLNVSIVSSLIILLGLLNYIDTKKYQVKENIKEESSLVTPVEVVNNIEEPQEEVQTEVATDPIVYDDLSLNGLADKLDRSLHSDLTGTGMLFAKYSLEYGVDPYLAVAIALHETGCGSQCNDKVTRCNNVGGQKFSPTCYAGGSYGKYDTLEQGIKGFVVNLSKNFIQRGLVTPEQIQPRYVGNSTSPWSSKIHNYMNKIKSN